MKEKKLSLKEKIEAIKAKYGVSPEDEFIDGKIAMKILEEIAELDEMSDEK